MVAVPKSEIIDWRVRTCQLSRLSSQHEAIIDSECIVLAQDLAPDLVMLHQVLPRPLRSKNACKEGDARTELETIYRQAFKTCLLIRCSKAEFIWNQKDVRERPLKTEEVLCVAKAAYPGYETFDAAVRAGNDYRPVFGEVVKRTGAWAHDGARLIHLRECEVILGPGFSPYKTAIGTRPTP